MTRRSDGGQATVELAIALPVVLVVLLAAIQVAVVVRNELAVEHAAREGARAASVSADAAGAANAAARRAVTLPVAVTTTDDGTYVSVTVTYHDPTDVALIGWMVGPIEHEATVTMLVEPP